MRSSLLFLISFLSLTSFSLLAQNNYCTFSTTAGCTEANRRSISKFGISYQNSPIFIYKSDCEPTGYADRTNYSINLTAGETYDVFISSNSVGVDLAGSWFDWNQDGDFDDANESVTMSGTGGENIGSFTVPADAVMGKTRVRAVFDFAIDITNCGTSRLGEAEDYTVLINEPRTDYCTSAGPDCAGGTQRHITDVIISEDGIFDVINNTSTCTSNGYEYFSGLPAAPLIIGATYEVLLFTDAFNRSDIAKVWIDWDGNKSFNEVGEGFDLVGNGGLFSGSFVVPPAAKSGLTRLRIAFAFSLTNISAGIAPCGQTNRGEVEDYNVFIDNPLNPVPPSCAENLIPADGDNTVCQNGVVLSWSPPSSGPDPAGYKLSFGTDNPPSSIYDSIDNALDTFNIITQKLAANTTYYWFVSPYDDNGDAECTINSFQTSANGDPVVSVDRTTFLGDTLNSCLGSSDIIQTNISGGTGTITYNWTGNDITLLSSTNAAQSTFTSNTLGSNLYYITVTDDNSCTSQDSIVVNSVENADASTISGTTQYCTGEALALNSPNAIGNLQWQRSSNGINWQDINNENSEDLNITNALDNENFRLIASTQFCSDTSNTFTVNIFAQSPAPTISSNKANNVFCQDDKITLSSSETNNNVWSEGSTTQSIELNNSANIELYYIDANSCNSQVASTSVDALPIPKKPIINEDINGEVNFCEGSSVTLSTNAGSNNIAWNGNPVFNLSTFTVSNQSSVFVEYTNSSGCKNKSTILLVNERVTPNKPIITTQDNKRDFCIGSSINLTANTNGNSFYWNGNTQNNTSPLVVSQSSTVILTAVDKFGCMNTSDNFSISSRPLPEVPTISTVNNSTDFCEGSSINLSANTNESTFYWNGNPQNSTSPLLVNQTSTNTLTAVNQFGCTNTSIGIAITERALPATPIISTIDNRNAFCDGDSLQLFSSSPDKLFWNDDLTNRTFIYVNQSGDYTVRAVNNFNCSSVSDNFTVIKNDVPEKPVISVVNNILTSSITSGSFQWFDEDDNPINGATSFEFKSEIDGSFYVTVTNPATGCSNRSDLFIFTGIFNRNYSFNYNLYPNPYKNGQRLNIQGKNQIKQSLLYNAQGQFVKSFDGNTTTDIQVAKGLYFVKVKTFNNSIEPVGWLEIN